MFWIYYYDSQMRVIGPSQVTLDASLSGDFNLIESSSSELYISQGNKQNNWVYKYGRRP